MLIYMSRPGCAEVAATQETNTQEAHYRMSKHFRRASCLQLVLYTEER